MDNCYLKSISASNFGPFAQEVIFTTESVKGKKDNIPEATFIGANNNEFNKVSFIFGANGSGKSNFCKIILQIQRAIMLSPIRSSGNQQLLDMKPFRDDLAIPRNHYKFDKKYDKDPTSYCIEIVINNIIYTYSFSISHDEKVMCEKLTKKNKRTETILERTSPLNSSIRLKSELSSFSTNVSVVKDNALCLSMAAFLNNELANKLIATITKINVVNMAVIKNLQHIDEESFERDKVNRYTSVLRYADPTLKSINVSFKEENVQKQKFGTDDFENREMVIKSISVDVESIHNVYENGVAIDEVKMPFLQLESTGTIKLFNILPVLFETLDRGGVLFIDEIENGLHPNIVKLIIDLFYNDDTNPLCAQLICTTHNMNLVEENVRRDQIWFMEKNEQGQSHITRMTDIPGVRNFENMAKRLNSSFGNVPTNLFKK